MTKIENSVNENSMASYGKAYFFMTEESCQYGRRIVSHEFPFQNIPLSQDLGKKVREFDIQGFVLTAEDLQKLILACENEGASEFFHPKYGALNVCCRSLSVNEKITEQGFYSISLKLIEDINKSFAQNEIKNIKNIDTKKMRLQSFDLMSTLPQGIQNVSQFIEDAKKEVKSLMNGIYQAQKLCADTSQLGKDLAGFIKNVTSDIEKISSEPKLISGLFKSSFYALSLSIDAFKSRVTLDNLISCAGIISSYSPGLMSPNHILSQKIFKTNEENFDKRRLKAWKNILNGSGDKNKIGFISKIVTLSFYTDAILSSQMIAFEDLDLLLSTIESLLENEFIFEEIYSSLIQTKKFIFDKKFSLIKNKTYVTHRNTNSLCLCYQLYGNIDSEGQFIQENNIKKPSQIQSQLVLKVI